MRTLLKSLLCVAVCLLAAASAVAAHGRVRHLGRHRRRPGHAHRIAPDGLTQRELFLRARAMAAAPTATGHFDDPWGLAADGAGDVYVVNSKGGYVDEIKPGFAIVRLRLSDLTYPISIAVDPERQHIFVGNYNGTGDVTEYDSSGNYEATITANAGYPESIAADEFDDLYLTAASGLAIDDADGNSISSDVYTPPNGGDVLSLTFSGPDLLAFFDGGEALGNGSSVLRGNPLPTAGQGLFLPDPTASACPSPTQCWVVDSENDGLEAVSNADLTDQFGLGYMPGGIAYDPVHKRVYISDPLQNKVYVYNSTALGVPIATLS